MQETIDAAMSAHFEETGDRPALQPEVKMTNEDWKEGDDVEVGDVLRGAAEVPDVDFASIEIEKLVAQPAESEVEEALKSLAESAQNFEDRKKGSKAKDGDQGSSIRLQGVGRRRGVRGGLRGGLPAPCSGRTRSSPAHRGVSLVGVKGGEEKDVKVSFPEEYGAAHLAGKDAVFACTVKAVNGAGDRPPIDDDSPSATGREDLEALKGQISERLAAEYGQASRAVMKRRLPRRAPPTRRWISNCPRAIVDAEAKRRSLTSSGTQRAPPRCGRPRSPRGRARRGAHEARQPPGAAGPAARRDLAGRTRSR